MWDRFQFTKPLKYSWSCLHNLEAYTLRALFLKAFLFQFCAGSEVLLSIGLIGLFAINLSCIYGTFCSNFFSSYGRVGVGTPSSYSFNVDAFYSGRQGFNIKAGHVLQASHYLINIIAKFYHIRFTIYGVDPEQISILCVYLFVNGSVTVFLIC